MNAVSAEKAAGVGPDPDVREEVLVLKTARARDEAIRLADAGENDAAMQLLSTASTELRVNGLTDEAEALDLQQPLGGFGEIKGGTSCFSPKVPHPLHSARLKFSWAKRHINTLDSEITLFLEQHSKGVIEKVDPTQADGYSYEVEWPDTPARWSTILGDIVHNFRSSLDNLAWQVRTLNGTPPDRLYFPIFVDPRSYRAQRHNWGFRPEHERLFRQFQPYQRGDAADSHPLRLLNKLSNIDKHQIVHTAVLSLEEPPTKPFRVIEEDPETGEREHIYGPVEYPVKAMEVIARVWGETEVYVQGDFAFTVEIREPGTILHEQRVLPLVRDISAIVERVIGTFFPVFR